MTVNIFALFFTTKRDPPSLAYQVKQTDFTRSPLQFYSLTAHVHHRPTDGRTDRRKSDLSSGAYYVTLDKNVIHSTLTTISVTNVCHITTSTMNSLNYRHVMRSVALGQHETRSSAVAKRPRDASCLYSFNT